MTKIGGKDESKVVALNDVTVTLPDARELRYEGRAGVITATDLYGLVELCREQRLPARLRCRRRRIRWKGHSDRDRHGDGPGAAEVARLL